MTTMFARDASLIKDPTLLSIFSWQPWSRFFSSENFSLDKVFDLNTLAAAIFLPNCCVNEKMAWRTASQNFLGVGREYALRLPKDVLMLISINF